MAGSGNVNEGFNTSVGAGTNNQIIGDAYGCFIGAGVDNSVIGAYSNYSIIGAGKDNSITSSPYCFIGAGANNSIISASFAAISRAFLSLQRKSSWNSRSCKGVHATIPRSNCF